MYNHKAPSNTSLSDDYDEDDAIKSGFFVGRDNNPISVIPVPAHWTSSRPSAVKSSDSSPISTIPPEILINIFKHVTSTRDLLSCIRVSKTWCECAIELLWHKPNFPKYGTMQSMGQVLISPRQTFTYARFIRRLNLMNLNHDLKDDVFMKFLACDRLERLTLVNCKGVSGELLMHMFSHYQNLIAIDLTNCSQITDVALINLAYTAKRLQGINLTGCTRVTDEGVLTLAESCPLLRRVKLSNIESITDKSVIRLAQSCPLLLEIDLNSCDKITDVAVRTLWQYSSHMREMRLAQCAELTDLAFPAPHRLETNAPPDVNPFPGSSYDCGRLLPPLILNQTFDHIRMLDLTACTRITDDAIEGIISHAPKIRNLVLSKCSLLTDKSVEAISKLGRSLHYLHLGHANKITDRSIRILARSCTRLRYIDFANCTLLTDMSVFELAALPKLRRIGLVRVNNLTDEAIYALAERHATLERIHLSYCDQITIQAIHFLLQKLHKLTHLSLTGIPAFRNTELQRFCREAPQEFNSAQRMAFCVYSGKGIAQLRNFLTELYDNVNENGTDDTEYEDDEYFNENGTPEPDAEGEGGDMEDGNASSTVNVHTQRAVRSGNQPTAHEFVLNRERTSRAGIIPTSTVPAGPSGSMIPSSVNIYGATSQLNAQVMAGSLALVPDEGIEHSAFAQPHNHHYVQGHRTMADLLPIVETPSASSIHSPYNISTSRAMAPDHPVEIVQGETPRPSFSQPYTVSIGLEMDVPIESHDGTMDVDAWTTVDADSAVAVDGSASGSASGSTTGEGRNWNMRRTLRDAGTFLFGRSQHHGEVDGLLSHVQTNQAYQPGHGRGH